MVRLRIKHGGDGSSPWTHAQVATDYDSCVEGKRMLQVLYSSGNEECSGGLEGWLQTGGGW